LTTTAVQRHVNELKTVIARAPNNGIKATKMAASLIFLGNYSEALKYVDKAVALEPYLMRVRMMRFEILGKLGRAKEAAPDVDAIVSFVERPSGSAFAAGDRMILSSRLIELYKQAGNVDGQIRVFEALANSGSAGESQFYDLGQCYATKKQWAKAVGAYDDALEYAVDNRPLIFEQRAKAHRMLGHAREAKADDDEVFRLRHKGRKM
jgi:tetratricopeptide (TPR) repeat protein